MRPRLFVLPFLACASLAFLQCVGDDPAAIANVDGNAPDGASPGTTTDDASSSNPATEDADAACGPGLATCGASARCAVKLADDEQHCGACGHACGGGACVEGECQPEVLASGLELPKGANIGHGFVADGDSVYFVSALKLHKVSKKKEADGGAQATAIHSGVTSSDAPVYPFIDASGRLLFAATGVGATGGKVFYVPPNGGVGSAVELANGQRSPEGVASDTTYAYWTTAGATQPEGKIVRRQFLGGASATDVVTDLTSPRHLAVGAGKLYWDLAIANNNAFSVADATPGAAKKVIVALGSDHVAGISVAQTGVFWVTYSGKEVWRATLGGDNPQKLYTGLTAGSGIAVDDTAVYATFQGTFGTKYVDGAVVRIPLDGSPAKRIADLPFVQGVVVDDDFVYVLSGNFDDKATGGTVSRIKK